MPFPPPRLPSGPRRRTLLASALTSAAGALLVSGCTAGGDGGDGGGATSGPSATERARARAAQDSAGLVARYDAVLAVHPQLAGRVRPLRDEVVRHVEAFGGATARPAPSGSASPSAAPSPAVPGTDREAVAQLAAAERELADRRAASLTDVDGELARLLASVAAAGAAHAFLLTEGVR
ncbi:hypothetical protein C3489_37770 [Streptomyces sp. Ru71]|uniref:hypothetical protein n=1 Tax=Streptomyces sp. Ru71 TaxID=2080746 RepID=UPI000CDD7AED|nr:hypothetical protein [Streptomyces sp. Ru71]POX43636.1 hypothetical protein C3489_37770 [Streptomyces sp. Ru71]